MNAASKYAPVPVQVSSYQARRLRMSRWLWKPWYAKLWWVGAIVYWIGFALSFWITSLRFIYESVLGGYLNVALYPPIILMILGVGYVRAKIRQGDWVVVAGGPELHRFNRSEGGSLDPYSDPLDPRSGSLWVGSPQNRARLFGRKWP